MFGDLGPLFCLLGTGIFVFFGLLMIAAAQRRKLRPAPPAAPPVALPDPGETWGYQSSSLKRKGSPWEEPELHRPTIATIRAVQDGWVRYYFGKGDQPEDDLVRPLQDFLRMYRRWPISQKD